TIAQAAAAARAAPTNAGAWLTLISVLQQAQRHDDESQALADAARYLPDHPQIMLATGISAFRRRKLDVAHQALTRASQLDPNASTPWIALARVAEMKGDLALTLKHTLHAVRLDAGQAPLLVDVGRGLQSVGRLDEAEQAYRGATVAQPQAVEAWRALAALLGEHGKTPAAMDALGKALALAPKYPDLHALAGDILRVANHLEDAARAYANALQLYPKSADLLNKLGCVQKQLGDEASAEQLLRQAVALDPRFHVARENLVTLHIERHQLTEARALLRESLAVPGLADEAKRNATTALAIFDEHDRLAPIIAQAVERGADAALADALSATSDATLPLDDAKLAAFRDLAQKTGGPVRTSENERFARGLPTGSLWPIVEAHFALHRGDDVESVFATQKLLNAAAAKSEADHATDIRKLQRYMRAIELRRTMSPPARTPAAREARLRFWHAAIGLDDDDFLAGQVKPTPNFVSTNPHVARTPPNAVAGTWRRLLTEHHDRAQPGPWRAALLYFAIVDMHGFRDGNGRLARFMMNVELEAAGYHPIVHTDRLIKSMAAALSAIRHMDDLEPLVDLFARASDDTVVLMTAIQAHDKPLH
ncbi:MAG: tetratricopeptide repeat protein, partial [Betaproteobacteria bacterium]